jgi:YaiO family outer membrane protein
MPPAEPPAIVIAAPASATLAEVEAARRRGDMPAARAAAERLVAAEPDNADAWLTLGFAESAGGDPARARAAFLRVLDIAPDYDDARLGLARLAWRDGDKAEARRWLATVDGRDDDEEVRALRAALREDGLWRWDASASYSALTEDLDPWREASLSGARRIGANTFGAAIEYADRFDITDTYGELRYVRSALRGRAAWGVAAGAAPDADFRPEALVRFEATASPDEDWTLDGALTLARYGVGEVSTLRLGAERAIGALAASARGIAVRDELQETRTGYALGAAWRFSSARASVSWTDAPESSEGVTVDVRSLGIGLAIDLPRDTQLRLGVAREERAAFDRTELTVGASRRF